MKHHIELLKALAGSIEFGGTNPFAAGPTDPVDGIQPADVVRFFEIEPPFDRVSENLPYCYIEHHDFRTARWGKRRVRRLTDGVNSTPGPLAGQPTQRWLRRVEGREYTYTLHFIVERPDDDILSDPISGYGIIDQARLYIENKRRYEYEERPVKVKAGMARVMSDPAAELAQYEIVVGVIFVDGLYVIDEVPTLAGGTVAVGNTTVEAKA